jgi:hypothetical protein
VAGGAVTAPHPTAGAPDADGPILVGFDTETGLILPGRVVPQTVCATYAGLPGRVPAALRALLRVVEGVSGRALVSLSPDLVYAETPNGWTAIATRGVRDQIARALLADAAAGRVRLIAHNAPYDVTSSLRPLLDFASDADAAGLWALTWRALEVGGVRDTQIREKLLAIHDDRLDYDPILKQKNPIFSLASLVLRRFGIDISGAKGDRKYAPKSHRDVLEGADADAAGLVWRVRFGELIGVPAANYPEDARQYAIEDAEWALRVFLDQGRTPVLGNAGHVLIDEYGDVTNEIPQVEAALALWLMSCWGIRTDPERVRKFIAHTEEKCAEASLIATYTDEYCAWSKTYADLQDGPSFADYLAEARRARPCTLHGADCADPRAEGEIEPSGFLRLPEKWYSKVPKKAGGGVRCKGCDTVHACDAWSTPAACPACGAVGKRSVNKAKLQAIIAEAYGGNPPLTPPSATHPTGQISTSRDTMKESGHPALVAYADLGVYFKYRSTYAPQLAHGTEHPINHGYGVLVSSGRTSAYKPNTQNPPRKGGFRECIVPRAGYVYCSVDYDIAELKALAQIQLWWFGHSALADAIKAGEDPHLSLAVEIIRLRMQNDATVRERWHRAGVIVPDYATIAKIAKDAAHPLYDDVSGGLGARQLAKIANFGFPGGLSPASFVEYARGYGVNLTDAEAVDLYHAWKSKWAEMALYFQEISMACASGSITIKQPGSNRQRGGCGYTQACNGYFQGLVADWAKAALVAVSIECYTGRKLDDRGRLTDEPSPLWGTRPVLFVHDEIIAEIPTGDLRRRMGLVGTETDAADRMAHLIRAYAQPYAPDLPITADPALMPRWYKGAKTVRDAAGRLIPWTPPEDHVPEPEPEQPDEGDDDLELAA